MDPQPGNHRLAKSQKCRSVSLSRGRNRRRRRTSSCYRRHKFSASNDAPDLQQTPIAHPTTGTLDRPVFFSQSGGWPPHFVKQNKTATILRPTGSLLGRSCVYAASSHRGRRRAQSRVCYIRSRIGRRCLQHPGAERTGRAIPPQDPPPAAGPASRPGSSRRSYRPPLRSEETLSPTFSPVSVPGNGGFYIRVVTPRQVFRIEL
jgi:hypothetical protein